MRNCFVPGCDSICRGMSKRRMFTAPKDKECLEAWIAVLPKIRPFKVHDKVCERHFNQEDISTTYDNIINGLVYKIERGRAKLKPKAVPCRHLNVDIKSCAKKRKRKASNPQIEKNVSVQIEQVKIDVQRNVEIEEVHDVQELSAVECSSTTAEDNLIAEEEQEEEHLESLEISQLQIQELFDTLYEDVYEVVLPNTLWGVHRCPERSAIFFSYVDPNLLRTTKMVSIDSQGQAKVLLGNRLLNEQSLVLDINSAGALSEAIAEIDEIKLCCKTFENEFCDVALKESSDICATCAQL